MLSYLAATLDRVAMAIGGFEIFNMKFFHKKLRCLLWPKKLEKLHNDCLN
jgi:hypothetical protein